MCMNSLSCIIPICDVKDRNKQDLENLLESIKDYPANIICCFDVVSDEFYEYFTGKYPNIIPIWNRKNRLNYAKNVNQGLRLVANTFPDDDILIINQDCILPAWEVMSLIQESEGLATPISIALSEIRDEFISLYPGSLGPRATNIVEDLTAIQRDKIPTKNEIKHKFAFYCPFISNSAFKKLGLLDGVYIATFEDDDYVTRALLAGIKCEVVDIKIHHAGTHEVMGENWESTSGSYNARRLGINLDKYVTKWGVKTKEVLNDSGKIDHWKLIPWILANKTWEDSMRIAP